MQKIWVFTLLFGLGSIALSTPLTLTPGGLDSMRVELDVTIDGTTKKFQLDTGANTTDLAPDSESLAYPSLGKELSRGASGIAIECDLIKPQILIVDTYQAIDPIIKRCDRGEHSFNNLGIDVFNNHIFEIDYKNAQLKFKDNFWPNEQAFPLLRLEKGHLKFPLSFHGQNIFGLFDTGAEITAVDLNFVESNPHLFKLILSQEKGRDINGQPVLMKFYEASNLKVGKVLLNKVKVAAFDFDNFRAYVGEDTHFIIGNNIIKKAKWMIDLKVNHWAAQPYACVQCKTN